MTAMPGPEFKDYTLVEESYAGSATVVFRGRRRGDGAKVAIKIPRSELPSPADTERIAREYALLKRIHIRGVPKAVGLEKHGSRLAFIMEELPGRPLRDVLRAKRLDQETILRVGASLAGVLGLLHLHGIVHRDIKPENILVDTATWDVQLVDFGAAAPLSRADDEQSGKGPLEGTLAYAPPEQTGCIARPVDQRADLYSLGVTLYEMAGEPG